MIRPIYLLGSQVLKERAAEIDLNGKEAIAALVQDLWDTLANSEGCGLAAPQIGVGSRVVVVDGDVMKDVYPYLEGFRRVLINPVILEESQTTCRYNEGCLSIPGIYADVIRPESLKVEYYDENLKKKVETFDKFGARMIQHELSHLDGVVFTDLVAPIRKKIIARKLQRITEGKVATRYSSKIK